MEFWLLVPIYLLNCCGYGCYPRELWSLALVRVHLCSLVEFISCTAMEAFSSEGIIDEYISYFIHSILAKMKLFIARLSIGCFFAVRIADFRIVYKIAGSCF